MTKMSIEQMCRDLLKTAINNKLVEESNSPQDMSPNELFEMGTLLLFMMNQYSRTTYRER